MGDIGQIKEPLFGYAQKIALVPVEGLKAIEVQRRPSPFHVKMLAESMKKREK